MKGLLGPSSAAEVDVPVDLDDAIVEEVVAEDVAEFVDDGAEAAVAVAAF